MSKMGILYDFLKLSLWNIISNSFILVLCNIFNEIIVTNCLIILYSGILLPIVFAPGNQTILLLGYPLINLYFISSSYRGDSIDEYSLLRLLLNEILCIALAVMQFLFTKALLKRQRYEARNIEVGGCPEH